MPEELNPLEKGPDPFNETKDPLPPVSDPPKKLNKKFIIGIVIAIFILIAGSVGAYYYFVALSPDEILIKSLENLSKLDSGTINYQLELSFKSKSSSSQNPDLLLGLLAPKAIELKAEIKSDFAKKDGYNQISSEIIFDIPTGTEIPLIGRMTYSPKVNVVSVEKDIIYFKVVGLPPIPFFDLSQFNNEWIKLDFKELESQYGFKITPPDSDSQKIEELREKFVDLYKKNSFMKLSRANGEKIEGGATYHYQMALDKEVFKNFVIGVNKIVAEEDFDQDYAARTETVIQSLEESLEKIEVVGEIWITKKGKLLRKVAVDITVDDEKSSVKVRNTILISNYNQAIEIQEPTATMTYKEAMELLTGGFGSGMFGDLLEAGQADQDSGEAALSNEDRQKAAQILADVKSTQASLELYFYDNQSYPSSIAGGTRLGVDATQLSGKGFILANQFDSKQTIYKGIVNPDIRSPEYDYRYYNCGDNYIIEFYLEAGMGGLSEGKNHASEDGIESTSQEIPGGCLD